MNRTDDVIPSLVEAGLDGIECFHTKHSTVTNEHYLELADRFHLLVTGGSDCHGLSKGKPLIGTVRCPTSTSKGSKRELRETQSPRPGAGDSMTPTRHHHTQASH